MRSGSWVAASGTRLRPQLAAVATTPTKQVATLPTFRKTPGSALITPPPDYTLLDAQPLNRAVTALFRRKMVAAVGTDVDAEG